MSSLDTTMEDEEYFFDSDTDAIIFGISDHSGWGGDSMISDPNIVSSPSTSIDDYQQQISMAVGGGGDDDLMIASSAGASSSRLNNNNKQSEIRIFNVDFRALSGVAVLSSQSCQSPQNNFPQFCIQGDEQNQDEEDSVREIQNSTSVYDVTKLCGWPSSRIVRVSRASGGKDRHSKVLTLKGLRDRRVRLSVNAAIQFYDLQDKLGYDQPSKAVEWLLKAAAPSISELLPL